MNTYLESIQNNNIQELTMETLKHWNRKFTEMNLFPFSQENDESDTDSDSSDERYNNSKYDFSKKRVSFHMDELRQKRPMDNVETLYLTSIGLFGIYLFYKFIQKTNMIP